MHEEQVFISVKSDQQFQVQNLERNESIWLQVENFDLYIKRTDEGIVVDIYDVDCESRLESLNSAHALDADTASFREDD
jgi:hypothetical protein